MDINELRNLTQSLNDLRSKVEDEINQRGGSASTTLPFIGERDVPDDQKTPLDKLYELENMIQGIRESIDKNSELINYKDVKSMISDCEEEFKEIINE